MPAKSQAQRRWAFGVKGAEWARRHHFDNTGHLPEKSKGMADHRKKRRGKKGMRHE